MRDLFRRIQLLFARGVVRLVQGSIVQVELHKSEAVELPLVVPYGFSYAPLPGAQAYALFKGGDRSNGVVIMVGDERYRLELKEGEMAIHNDKGDKVHIKEGKIEVEAATQVLVKSSKVLVEADLVELGGIGGKPVVTEDTICPFTGNNHFGGIPSVKVKK